MAAVKFHKTNPAHYMSVAEYAAKRRITTQAVYAAIRRGHAMPGVKSLCKSAGTWLLEIDNAIIR